MAETGFSFRSRADSLRRFRDETFDLLIIGGGITGAGVARDAASRGLRVALLEKSDFAAGTSSRSSKLIHGGLRYLQNLELHLVFEALSERALLLRTAPHLVHPLKFFYPVFRGDANGRAKLSLGLWLYDLLALFRTPGAHKGLSRARMLEQIPFLKADGLRGGFQYYDASMWDDALAVETVRAAADQGAAVANYVEALSPLWDGERIAGFRARDREGEPQEFEVRAARTVICAGPWTDLVGEALSPAWRHWLKPSKGVHLIFDLKRIPIPGAMVMSNPEDGRISFVIPRPDLGAGVVIVGTTDGPSPAEPSQAAIDSGDLDYLFELLGRYFPELRLTPNDIVSAYIGVRPLMGSISGHWDGKELKGAASGEGGGPASLQKVSREHHIDMGPGGTVVVAGGKYTTHRKMAAEIVDFTLSKWKKDFDAGRAPAPPAKLRAPDTTGPVNPDATRPAMEATAREAASRSLPLPRRLIDRYGADALRIWELARGMTAVDRAMLGPEDPDGFPCLLAQLRYSIRREMTMHLTDFYLRRTPLFASRADHGLPWCDALGRVWAEELGRSDDDARTEITALHAEIARRESWRGGASVNKKCV